MRIIFMGNPTFSVPSLTVLSSSSHEIAAVVTNPDKPQGRGRNPLSTPVAKCAGDLGIPIVPAENLKDDNLTALLSEFSADLFVVVAFKILPERLLDIPKIGCVNLHGSILPKYRGAAPIQRALLNGDSLTGLTTFQLKPSVDTGDVLLKKEVVIYPSDNCGVLSERMSYVGAQLLKETVDRLESGEIESSQQDNSLATKAPKINLRMRVIDWSKSTFEIHNLIRALTPKPGVHTVMRGKRLKICRSHTGLSTGTSPGMIISANKNSFRVSCGSGSLQVLEVQVEGKKKMSAREFLAGSKLTAGDCFDSER
ncbi:MAG: methionyl-tRNA formyltransferase [Candidatus Marinimicrobia bacterium]|nr:methionyl-tRNA formyltransferase [Candidatus Neomarinimicrobiota bacterium]